jgi:hypothetical protein
MVAGRNRTATTALHVSIPVVGTLSVSLLIAAYLVKNKRNIKPRKPVQIASAGKCRNKASFPDEYLLRRRIGTNWNMTGSSMFSLRTEQEDTEDMIISEDLVYELRTLRAATEDFSVENKLGEGGFGTVYKVQ